MKNYDDEEKNIAVSGLRLAVRFDTVFSSSSVMAAYTSGEALVLIQE